MVAVIRLDLSVPASPSSASIRSRMFFYLIRDRTARRVQRDLPGQIDRIAMDNGLTHARSNLNSLQRHAKSSLNYVAIL